MQVTLHGTSTKRSQRALRHLRSRSKAARSICALDLEPPPPPAALANPPPTQATLNPCTTQGDKPVSFASVLGLQSLSSTLYLKVGGLVHTILWSAGATQSKEEEQGEEEDWSIRATEGLLNRQTWACPGFTGCQRRRRRRGWWSHGQRRRDPPPTATRVLRWVWLLTHSLFPVYPDA